MHFWREQIFLGIMRSQFLHTIRERQRSTALSLLKIKRYISSGSIESIAQQTSFRKEYFLLKKLCFLRKSTFSQDDNLKAKRRPHKYLKSHHISPNQSFLANEVALITVVIFRKRSSLNVVFPYHVGYSCDFEEGNFFRESIFFRES